MQLPEIWDGRCDQYGEGSYGSYVRGEKPASLARTVDRKGLNKERLAFSKKGECIGALFERQDPECAVDWQTQRAGATWDVVLGRYRGQRILTDFKTIECWKSFLLFPVSMDEEEYKAREFDLLALVRQMEVDPQWFELVGCVTKKRFLAQHHVAQAGDGTKLETGTWYMWDYELHNMDELAVWLRIPGYEMIDG